MALPTYENETQNTNTYLLINQDERDGDLHGCRNAHADKLQKALKLRRIVGHHVDDLASISLGPSGCRHAEGFAVEHGGDGRPDKDGAVCVDGLVAGLE